MTFEFAMEELLLRRYTRVAIILKVLDELGCTIVHEVDATMMSQHPLVCNKSFDRIVFNFPHAGFVYKDSKNMTLCKSSEYYISYALNNSLRLNFALL